MAFKLKFGAAAQPKQSGEIADARSASVLGHLPFKLQLRLLGSGVLISLLAGIASALLDFRATSNGENYIEQAGQLVMLTQRVAKDAGSALQGKQTAVDGLPQARADVERILEALDKGSEEAPALSGEPRAALDKLLPLASQHLGYIKEVEAGKPALIAITRAVEMGRKVVPQLRDELGKLSFSGEKAVRIAKLDQLLERIDIEVNILLAGLVNTERFDILKLRLDSVEEQVAALDQSNPAVAKLLDPFYGYRDAVRVVIGLGPQWIGAKQGANKYFDGVSGTKHGPFLVGAQELDRAIFDSQRGRRTTYALAASGIALLVFMALLAQAYLEDARRRAMQAEELNKKNQNAILRLMNELGDLADGDLTVRATVTEDITGSIADSVNYTTEELQKLVRRVVAAAEQMGRATREAEETSRSLQEATQKQVREIQGAGESVQLMSQSIREVDAVASKAAEVGRHTLESTSQGAQAVRNTISGMDGIREQIQETSKRIKRLGESSQEIGEIVDMISDITEQTNVLALNAAIQAVSAGEAGRGFSVVAEEVQRLAERSADATRKISALIKTIQSDTHDAVAAMEKSTMGVVEGTKLSDMAGQSLKEIGLVSNELAALINSISVSTQMQTDMAAEVSGAMQDILKITEQTTEGTRQTANSVGQLAVVASDLKGSVSGFKL